MKNLTSLCLLLLSFFVPLLSEDRTDKENEQARDFRMANFQAIMKEQFQLTYYEKVDYGASEQMSVLERHTMYKILVEQKQIERKAQEDAIKAAEAKKKSGSWRRKR